MAAIGLPRRPGGHPTSERGDHQGWAQGTRSPAGNKCPRAGSSLRLSGVLTDQKEERMKHGVSPRALGAQEDPVRCPWSPPHPHLRRLHPRWCYYKETQESDMQRCEQPLNLELSQSDPRRAPGLIRTNPSPLPALWGVTRQMTQ